MDKPAYAGIGSRETPEEFLKFFSEVGEYLGKLGMLLRSGGADGADSAFEEGCDRAQGRKQIFLPWPGFNGNKSEFDSPPSVAFDIAKRFHPMWIGMRRTVQRLHARNSQQILGPRCDNPVLFVLCWTHPNKGGTTQALRIAKTHKIPIYNFFLQDYDVGTIVEPHLQILDQVLRKERTNTTWIRIRKGAY